MQRFMTSDKDLRVWTTPTKIVIINKDPFFQWVWSYIFVLIIVLVDLTYYNIHLDIYTKSKFYHISVKFTNENYTHSKIFKFIKLFPLYS